MKWAVLILRSPQLEVAIAGLDRVQRQWEVGSGTSRTPSKLGSCARIPQPSICSHTLWEASYYPCVLINSRSWELSVEAAICLI